MYTFSFILISNTPFIGAFSFISPEAIKSFSVLRTKTEHFTVIKSPFVFNRGRTQYSVPRIIHRLTFIPIPESSLDSFSWLVSVMNKTLRRYFSKIILVKKYTNYVV